MIYLYKSKLIRNKSTFGGKRGRKKRLISNKIWENELGVAK